MPGYPDEAARYGELAARYEKSAAIVPVSPGNRASSPAASAAPTSSRSVRRESSAESLRPRPNRGPWPRRQLPNTEMAAAAHPQNSRSRKKRRTQAAAPRRTSFAVSEALLPKLWPPSGRIRWPSKCSRPRGMLRPRRTVARYCRGEAQADAAHNPEIAETVEEIRFYLEHFMTEQARAGMEKLEALTSDARILDPLRAAVASASQPPAEPEAGNRGDQRRRDLRRIRDSDRALEIRPSPGSQRLTDDWLRPRARREMTKSNQGHHARRGTANSRPNLQPTGPNPLRAEAAHAGAGEVSCPFVADLEASLGDSFPEAPPTAAPRQPDGTRLRHHRLRGSARAAEAESRQRHQKVPDSTGAATARANERP